jgi:diaminopimelate decarboxylase
MRRLELFPLSTRIQNRRLNIGGCDLATLAEQFGTPLYLYDQETLDESVQAYQRALQACYPASWGLTYAGKAFLCPTLARWTQKHRLRVDCTGAGEVAAACAAGVPREQILMHGVNKSPADLQTALEKAGTVVVDNLTELQRLIRLRQEDGSFPDLWLRLLPGESVSTHAYTQTGHHDSKFGMDEMELTEAIRLCRQYHLPLRGLHFHQGSQFRDPAPLGAAIEKALDLAQEMSLPSAMSTNTPAGLQAWILSPGGGWGVAYHEDDLPQPNIHAYIAFIAERVQAGCAKRGLPLPHLHLEPGRSLVARAGVAIYQVGTIKHRPGRIWLLVDGGLADNPRPALYGARYTALPVIEPERPPTQRVSIAGPYCESGDILIEDLPMPEIHEGEWIAIPVSGAYHLSMSSNYNGALRPAVVWLEGGKARLIQRRETTEDYLQRELSDQA